MLRLARRAGHLCAWRRRPLWAYGRIAAVTLRRDALVALVGTNDGHACVLGSLHGARAHGTSGQPHHDRPSLVEYFVAHSDESALFNAAMVSKSHAVLPAVAVAYDFGRFGTVADVGGGRGHLLSWFSSARRTRTACCSSVRTSLPTPSLHRGWRSLAATSSSTRYRRPTSTCSWILLCTTGMTPTQRASSAPYDALPREERAC